MYDLRLAFRSLRATPIVTAVAVLSLALGIGANTAIFSIIDSLLLRPLPVRDPGRLALVSDSASGHVRVWSYPIWMQIRQRSDLFERSAAWSFTQFNLASGGETQPVDGLWASGSFFETLGVPAIVGRVLTDADDGPRSPDGAVAVISYGFWQRRFGGALDVIGRSLRVETVAFTIVGVMPPGFFGPDVGRSVDVVVPIATEPLIRRRDSFLDSSGTTFLTMMVRLRSDQSHEAATAALESVRPQIRAATIGDVGQFGSRQAFDRYLSTPFRLEPGATGYSVIRDQYTRPLMTILAVVVVLLLIACVNIANLLAARAIERRHELGVRLALGASRWRLVRQLLAESALLYGAGASTGLAIAMWGSRVLVAQISSPAATVFLDLTLDGRVLLFTAAITVATTLLFGTVPAFRASSAAPMDALQQHGRTIAGRSMFSSWLIAAQVALALVLIAAAGLFVRTFASLAGRPLGFDAGRIVVVTTDAHQLNTATERLALYDRARSAVRNVPGVADAALSLTTPVANGQFTPRIELPGVIDTQGPVWGNLISPDWFATYGTPVVAGRDVAPSDRAGAPRVAVVNEMFALKFLRGSNPIGKTFAVYPGTPRRLGPIAIVGVVRDAVYGSLRAAAPPTYYLPLAQFEYLTELGIRSINLSVRATSGSPMALTRHVAAAVADVDPQLSLTFRPLAGQIDAALAQDRLVALLAAVFGGLALVLAAVGLYGVTAYAVARRRTEIGIRMALGATPRRVVSLVLSRVSVLVGIGVLVGVAMSAWTSRFVAALLYGVQPTDPATLVGAAAILAAAAGVAGWLPAWRASRIDPAEVLRES